MPCQPIESADDGCDDRCDAVDGADQRQHPGQVAASEPVGGDRPRNDNAARTGNALQETRSDELADVRGEDAEQGGADEEPHGRQQRRSASVFVAQGTEEQLSGSQADHAGGESHLHHRRGGMEEIRHGGQRRQVHIRYERTECCQQAQQDEQVNFAVVFVHNTLFYRSKITLNFRPANRLLGRGVVQFRNCPDRKNPCINPLGRGFICRFRSSGIRRL